MPSTSRLNFERHLLRDVDQLRGRHRLAHPGPGRPASDLTRSGVFLLCAAWELYAEEVIIECFKMIITEAPEPLKLPKTPRQTLAKAVKADKHELAVLKMAGEGWREYFFEIAKSEVASLNTPSANNINRLFGDLIGIDTVAFFEPNAARISTFISKRGDIAHKGSQAGHVSINDLDLDYAFICGLVRDLDNFLVRPLQQLVGRRPWNRRG